MLGGRSHPGAWGSIPGNGSLTETGRRLVGGRSRVICVTGRLTCPGVDPAVVIGLTHQAPLGAPMATLEASLGAPMATLEAPLGAPMRTLGWCTKQSKAAGTGIDPRSGRTLAGGARSSGELFGRGLRYSTGMWLLCEPLAVGRAGAAKFTPQPAKENCSAKGNWLRARDRPPSPGGIDPQKHDFA